jgi:mannose-6-phosphate isomerase-like protein (cupin superfamily)
MNPDKQTLIAAMADLPQEPAEAGHLWADGVCMRTMSHPAGTVIVGAEYKKSHIFYLASGSVMIDVAGESTVITAGDVFVARAGSQTAL